MELLDLVLVHETVPVTLSTLHVLCMNFMSVNEIAYHIDKVNSAHNLVTPENVGRVIYYVSLHLNM